jgi:hypothetical protein
MPIFVVQKKPAEAEDTFSAVLLSGAKHLYYKPEKRGKLVSLFLSKKNTSKTPLLRRGVFLWDTQITVMLFFLML